MTHNTLENYYRTIFILKYKEKLNMDIEEMIPYERDVYVSMINMHHEENKMRKQVEQNKIQAMQRF